MRSKPRQKLVKRASEAKLFVFFGPGQNPRHYNLNLPFGWRMINDGLGQKRWPFFLQYEFKYSYEGLDYKYCHEAEFRGPLESRPLVRKYLQEQFSILESESVIDTFKIKNTFGVPNGRGLNFSPRF